MIMNFRKSEQPLIEESFENDVVDHSDGKFETSYDETKIDIDFKFLGKKLVTKTLNEDDLNSLLEQDKLWASCL